MYPMATYVKNLHSPAIVLSSEKVASSAARDGKTSTSLRREVELPILLPMDDATRIPEHLTSASRKVSRIFRSRPTHLPLRSGTRPRCAHYEETGRWAGDPKVHRAVKGWRQVEEAHDRRSLRRHHWVVGAVWLPFAEAQYKAYRLKRVGALREDGDTVPALLEAYGDYCALRESEWSHPRRRTTRKT